MNVTAEHTGCGSPSIVNGEYFQRYIARSIRRSYAGLPVDLSRVTFVTVPRAEMHSLNDPISRGLPACAMADLVSGSGAMAFSPAMRCASRTADGTVSADSRGAPAAAAPEAAGIQAGFGETPGPPRICCTMPSRT